MKKPRPPNPEWEGFRRGVLGIAIVDRIKVISDELSPLMPAARLKAKRLEIVALLEQFPGMPEVGQ